MKINWIIIILVAVAAIGLIAYLIWQNQKDKKKVSQYFNTDITALTEEEEELNNSR